jgi:GTP-binding protein Era
MKTNPNIDEIVARAAERDKKAEIVIWSNTVANAGTAILPLGTSVIAFILANTTMIIALGHIYGFTMSREQAGGLIRQILFSIGATWGLGVFAMKLGAEVAKVAGVTTAGMATLVACSVDSILSGSLSYALGYTSMTYFKNGCVLDKDDMRRIFKARMQEGKEKIKSSLDNGDFDKKE